MQSLEILKVTIKKRIFVVPLNLESNDRAIARSSHMVNLMGLRFPLYTIDDFLNFKDGFIPALLRKPTTQSLGRFGLAPSGSDQLFNRNFQG